MKRIKCLLCALATLFVALFFLPQTARAQHYELGIFAGGCNYQGDLADGYIVWNQTQPAVGGFVRFAPLDFLSLKASFTYGNLIGGDRFSGLPNIRERGYAFESNIRELGFFAEVHLPKYGSSGYGMFRTRFSPFVFAGFGFTNINSQPTAPADRVPYPFPEIGSVSSFFAGSMGGGFKLHFASNFATSIEWGARTPFSDYLDGVSFRGNPGSGDWYMFGGLTLSYVLDGGNANPFRGRLLGQRRKRGPGARN